MKNRDIYWRRYKIQETVYIGQSHLRPLQSRHVGTSHSSPNPHQLPCFPKSHQWTEIPSLSEVILVLENARSCRAPNLGCRGAESPGWFDVSPKNSAWNVMHKQGHYSNEAANHQLPIAVAFWIIQIVSTEECSSLTQHLMQIPCSTHSVILNAMATQYTCSLNGIYCPHWLVQWTCHCSHIAFQSTLLGCQVTFISCKPFLLY